MKLSYLEFIQRYVNSNSFGPISEGGIKSGVNGLYGEKETIYRNLAHWSCLLMECGSLYENEIDNGLAFLINSYDYKGSYVARDSIKNKSNGLIGTSWIIEAVAKYETWSQENKHDLVKPFSDLISRYHFDSDKGIWDDFVEPDGSKCGIDRTFNHQLWFACAVAELVSFSNKKEFQSNVPVFIDKLATNLKCNMNGAIYHTLGCYPHYHRTLLKRIISKKYRADMNQKEWGYHAFNLLGFVRLGRAVGGNDLIDKHVNRLLDLVKGKKFWSAQRNNPYSSSYNPVGLEIAAALSCQLKGYQESVSALNFHFKSHFDSKKFEFYGSSDDATLNARFYEIIYISEELKSILYFDDESNEWHFA